MCNQEYIDDLKPPFLQKLFSMCSNFSDQEYQRHPPKLEKWNSYIEPELVPEKQHIAYGETNNIHDESPNVDENLQEQKEEIKQEEFQPCSCQKTHCLKMYCSCFHNGRFCGKSCRCEECENTEEFKMKRMQAVDYVKKKAHRNKKVPKEKIFETVEIWGCNCSKTRCVKKYCECFIRGKKCTVECNCDHCDNGKDEDLFNEIKKQNEKPKTQKRIRKERQPLQ
ncbi:unnamed protein product (macronuclear) [Paramecium tetraurelia]|uniref:CRC domain-containing protein n=1 Tax=Paramecium tetraurelia TaxID=5888 RepID=A0BYU0_PARTE|nr:uncharacterized protein GSPATT00033560001 [Paramecium tetraurelia]CAK63707.1 unnamed protein product [Paramecium tetraurelia]|eukprot:XP_001431105.1 hypothetical protein (macronuclear) [Paramecium tetraurelia strain d4-2]